MTARTLIILPLTALALSLLAAACGGDGDEEAQPARLTDPRSVATATPWGQPPEPIILGPDVLTPVGGNGGEDGNGGNGGDQIGEITDVEPFQITSDESTNIRTTPSTDGGIAGTLKAGEEATVTGEVSGEEVSSGNDLWYRLEGGDFVYSGAVKKVE